ncbi:hypothetical protein [Shinella sp.]|uniref:hypothetical protein n=1 Tax=Shinella sp. TaxID=1870904 RepID=UPI004035DE44
MSANSANLKQKVATSLASARSAARDIARGVEEIRSQLLEVQERRRAASNAPVDIETSLQRLDKYLDRLTRLAGERAPGPKAFMQSPPSYREPNAGYSDIAFAYLDDLIRERMASGIKEAHANAVGLTESEREERLRAFDRDILDIELAEESLIRAAEAANFPIQRRAAADPRAVLAHDKVLP